MHDACQAPSHSTRSKPQIVEKDLSVFGDGKGSAAENSAAEQRASTAFTESFYALLRRHATKPNAEATSSRALVGSGTPAEPSPAPAPAFAKRTLSMMVVI